MNRSHGAPEQEEVMATKSTPRGLRSMLAVGVKDLPRNASWLMAKALNPGTDGATESAGSKLRDIHLGNGVGQSLADTVRSAGATIKDALPTGNSVELRLQRARAATEQARAAEDQAMKSAELARQKVEEFKRIDQEERARVKAVRKEHAQEVDQRVADARRA